MLATTEKRGYEIAASALFLVNGQQEESNSDNPTSARQPVEWPKANLSYITLAENRFGGKRRRE